MKLSFPKHVLDLLITPLVTIISELPLYQRVSAARLIYNFSDEMVDKKGRTLYYRFNHIVISSFN